jgi:hypothetical protein
MNTFGAFHREIDVQHCWQQFPSTTDRLWYNTTPNGLRYASSSYFSQRENHDYEREDFFRQGILSSQRIGAELELVGSSMIIPSKSPVPDDPENNNNMSSDTWDDVSEHR